jgi:hypothetical protein
LYSTFQNPGLAIIVLTGNPEIDSYLVTHSHQIGGIASLIGITAIVVLFLKDRNRAKTLELASAESALVPPKHSYTCHQITEAFLSSIPTITAELNLEVATTEQIETFDRTDKLSVLWGFLHLGTSTASIRVPVTYRYHIRLDETWQLALEGNILRVHAPAIRASLPPAFHSDRMTTRSVRGWFRSAPDELLRALHHEITPVISKYAEDPRRIALIRESCRLTTAEFVRKCLLANPAGLPPEQAQRIEVRFAGEPRAGTFQRLRLNQPPTTL